ncbi:MAG TPA: hypothetical protein VFV07_00500 [Rhizomicrobium sp.]|nr:hypothetical protein [Rhizomicrobium sp.]
MSMSVDASRTLNPALSVMLAQLAPSGGTTGNSATAFPDMGAPAPATGVATGSGKAQVSSDILNLFSQMHQAAGSAHHGGGAGPSSGTSGSTTTMSTASTMISPLDQLMNAIGMDDDPTSTEMQFVDPNSLLPDQTD